MITIITISLSFAMGFVAGLFVAASFFNWRP